MANFLDLGKHVINPKIGLYLNEKEIPMGTKGEVNHINYEDDYVSICWYVLDNDGKEKKVSTRVKIEAYDKLIQNKVLDLLNQYIDKPEPKYGIGDLVDDLGLGIIIRRKYDGIDKTWYYIIAELEEIFWSDWDLRFSEVEEKYIQKVDKINAEPELKGSDSKFKLTFTERK